MQMAEYVDRGLLFSSLLTRNKRAKLIKPETLLKQTRQFNPISYLFE